MVENHHSGSFEAVRYTVRFPEPHTHYVEVEAMIPVGECEFAELFLPVWTPGSYLIREYSRNIEAVSASGVSASGEDGRVLDCGKSRKNRWSVRTEGARWIRLRYRAYGRELSVRTNWVEESFALLNGAPTFITRVGGLHLPHEVRVELPDAWKISVSGLEEASPHCYRAPDYDTLVDSPILAGNPALYRFEVDGIPHVLANVGEEGVWDGPRSASDVTRIVRTQRDLWGGLPYTKYVFLNLLTETTGGLEHRNSMCVMASRWATRTRRAYLGWLSLLSHEFFHVWNVKRLRPAELGPFDYENENHTRSLWVAEGFTDYYGPLLAHRAGLTTRQEYFGSGNDSHGSLGAAITMLQNTPGRLVQSAEESSYDAWIKLYRPDENSRNTSVSYYTKGAVVGWLLDARIRRATAGAKSLDDLMRLAYARWSGERGFTPDEMKAAAEEIAGEALREFFEGSVEAPGELDYAEALGWFGLRFRNAAPSGKASLGAETKVDHGRLLVTRVARGTVAFAFGLNVDDEIVAIGDFRVRADHWTQRLENYRPGDEVSLLIARREKLLRLPVTLGEEPARVWQPEALPGASAEQKRNLNDWLS